jgi:hypothetical protein
VRFPLDALWASASVDCIGIDYYAPLADWRDQAGQLDQQVTDSPYRLSYLASNLAGGEAYDWYYADDGARAAQMRSAISDGLGKPWLFRQKDIWNFWSQAHYERVGGVELPSPTAWVPQSKPTWLTEIGCPAVDKGANQPSVFPDPKSSEAGLPHFSNGRRDDLIQRRYLEAVLGAIDPDFGEAALNPVSAVYGGRMLPPDGIHLWTWDARPYPAFPANEDAWSDGPNWQTGHWLTGRFGATPLDGLVAAILSDNAARAPVFGLNSALNIGRPAAAKTGTTNDYRDSLTVGYTPQLVTGVWVGNTDNSPMDRVAGASGAAAATGRCALPGAG